MSPAVCVPTSIPDFYGAFSLKARAPQHSYNPVNAGSASWRNRGMLTKITRIEVGHCYLNSEKTGKKVLKDQMRHGDVVDHRFVQCGGVKKPRNAGSSKGCDFLYGTI